MQEQINQQPKSSEAGSWRLYSAFAPHRSVDGEVVLGLVWRQRQDGRWIYMRADRQVKAAVELVEAAHRSRLSRRLRRP
jgi:hypothetical protein